MAPLHQRTLQMYLLILCLHRATQYQVETTGSSWPYVAGTDNHRTIHKLERRAANYGLMGILAWKQLLKGSVPLTSFSKRYRLYEKSGSYEDALKDFYAVYPKHVRIEQDKPVHRVNQGTIVSGYVGDKLLRLVENGGRYGKYSPTLDVIGKETTDRPYIDKIIYKSRYD